MKKFSQLMEENGVIDSEALNESMHPELQHIMDSDEYPLPTKITRITKHVKTMIGRGEDTGLENDKPKKGSSRAVWFPKEPKKLVIDGQPTQMHTAIKIAYPGWADKALKNKVLMGQLQNEHENSSYIQRDYAVLHHHEDDGRDDHFVTNHNGILAPVTASHEDDHWLEMPKVSNITSAKFKKLTKTEDYPEGLDHQRCMDAVIREHDRCYGKGSNYTSPEDQKILDHPFTQQLMSLCHDSDTHPHDFRAISNLGVFTHPVTGKEYPVIRDYGYNKEIAKQYHAARKAEADKHEKMRRGY